MKQLNWIGTEHLGNGSLDTPIQLDFNEFGTRLKILQMIVEFFIIVMTLRGDSLIVVFNRSNLS